MDDIEAKLKTNTMIVTVLAFTPIPTSRLAKQSKDFLIIFLTLKSQHSFLFFTHTFHR